MTTTTLLLRDVLEGIRAGRFPPPPAAALLGLEIVEIGDGTAVFALTPAPEHLNATGTVNGGLLATLADFAVCCAVSDVPASAAVSTAGLHVTYQQAVTLQTGRVRATASVLHRTARAATVEARITDARGRLHAHATATVVVRPAGAITQDRSA
jgi:uncharacterized protein (TIGR00369 family)